MKFNLNNFPLKVNQQGIDLTLMTTLKLSKDGRKVIKIAKWKVGFENQIRELLDGERLNHEAGIAMEECGERADLLSHSWGRIQLLKQILGDEK